MAHLASGAAEVFVAARHGIDASGARRSRSGSTSARRRSCPVWIARGDGAVDEVPRYHDEIHLGRVGPIDHLPSSALRKKLADVKVGKLD